MLSEYVVFSDCDTITTKYPHYALSEWNTWRVAFLLIGGFFYVDCIHYWDHARDSRCEIILGARLCAFLMNGKYVSENEISKWAVVHLKQR